MKETLKFQTESKQLLNLMINSIYTNKEIFIRELISNASDAIDKYKYIALTSNGKYPQKDYQIVIKLNKDDRYIEIADNGIGMSHDELVNNLGTIAKSGSKDFLEKFKKAKESKDLDIIGQFGVGFYSAFMVAKKVEVYTKTIDDKAYVFSSDGLETFTLDEGNQEDTGTTVRIYLKDDTEEEKYSNYLDSYQVESLVKKYSDYIRYPIKMDVKTSKPKLDKDGKPIEGQFEDVVETKTLNSMIPLWKKNKKDVTDEELANFYKDKFHDYEDPLISMFLNVDGVITYSSLIFIPSHAPYNLYSADYEKGLDLYSKGVFVKEKCKELVPDYLKFIKGLVDSEDFALNISREMLQSSPVLRRIQDNIEKKVIERLKELKNTDYPKYLNFFKIYGDNLKFGIYKTYGANKDLLQDLLVFNSLNNPEKISLKDYKDKMKPDQKYIYYASGKTLDSIKILPQIEKYKKNGIDVLLLDGEIDEFTLMMMHDYDKSEFKNISDEKTDELNQEEKDKISSLVASNKRIIDDIKEALKDKVDDVTFSTKLVDSPVCITTKEGLSLNMEHVLNEQPNAKVNPDEQAKAIKVLEINPEHPLFKAIQEVGDNDELIKKYGALLYDEAMMLEGFDLSNKSEFIKNLNDIMLKK